MRRALSAPRRGVAGFFRGLSLPFRGAKLVYVEHLDLARLWLVPIAITIVVLAASVGLVLHESSALVAWIWPTPEADADWWVGALRGALAVLIDALLVVLALLVTLLVSGVVAAPFNARLAEVLDERLHGIRTPEVTWQRLAADVLRSAVVESTFALVNVALFLSGLFLPALGPLLTVLGLAAWALYFAVGYVDVPQASRGKSLGDRVGFVGKQLGAMLGFGTGVGLFLLVPLVNLLFMPAAVAGGVLLVAEAEAEDPAAPPPGPPAADGV